MSKLKHILSGAVLSVFLFAAVASTGDDSNSAEAIAANSENALGLNETLQTEYFAVKVNKFDFKDKVNTGNEFSDLPKEEGNKYIIVNVTLKNISSESRMMFDGELLVKSGEQVLKYENSETVMLEGWGILMDNINPGVTKTTNIVYKVPADLTGDVFYVPARAKSSQLIKIGTL